MASNSDATSTSMPTTTVAAAVAGNPTVVTAATVASTARPVAQLQPISQHRVPQVQPYRPHRHHPYQHPPHQPGVFSAQTQPHPHLGKASDPIRYPLASSGRGLLPTHPTNSGTYPPMPNSIVANSSTPHQYQLPHSRFSAPADSSHHPAHLVRAPFLHPSHMSPVSVSAARGFPLNNHPPSKVGSSPYSAPDFHAPKDPIDQNTDDKLVTLRDRKVRISEGASLYALCRSWLRNGYPEEIQHGDVVRSLPRPLPLPLPLPLPESSSPKRKESDEETEADEAEKLNEISNAEELLTRHVKRAKRVRARLREERSLRIERYESRLTLLLRPNGAM